MGLGRHELSFQYVNAAFAGCSALGARAYDDDFKDITHPDDIQESVDGVRKLAAGEISVFQPVKRYLRKDQTILWGATTITVIHDQNDQFLYFLALVEDITEKKMSEEALRSSEEQMRAIVESAPFGAHFYVFNRTDSSSSRALTRRRTAFKGEPCRPRRKIRRGSVSGSGEHRYSDIYRRVVRTGFRYYDEQINYHEGVILGRV